MLTKSILLFLFVALSLQTTDLGIKKSQDLREKVLNAGDEILSLTAAEYQYFVEESPRPYDVIVYFTAPQCNMCDDVEGELTKVSTLYKQGGAIYPYKDETKQLRAVYIVKVPFDQTTRNIFVKFGFKSVPNLLVSQPKMLRLKDNERSEYYRNYLWQISMSDGILTSQKLLEYANKRTARSVEYKESIFNLLIVLVVFGSILGAGVGVFLKFKPVFLNTKLWFVGSMLVYFICMSGIVYNIIHQVPFSSVDRDGNVEWIHSGGRSQYGAEGYLMSGSISILGILFILLFNLPKLNFGMGGKIIYIVLFVVIFLMLKFVESIYKQKSGFYNPAFWPPGHYMHGPLSNDQGNNI